MGLRCSAGADLAPALAWRLTALLLLAALAGCVAPPRPRRGHATHAYPPAVVPAEPPAKVAKSTALIAQIPRASELPGLVGVMQRHTVAPNETLLTIARDGGLGFRELRDANPRIDEWEPRPGTDLVVPSRFILPRSGYRGLVANLAEMRLYLFPLDAEPGMRVPVLTWPIGIGAEFAQSPIGSFTVKSKDTHPTWVVPDSIYRKMEHPRHVVPPGPDNPLGEYRIRTSIDVYAIHGTNDPWTVGRLTTHGCIRLYPEDIANLYRLVDRGFPGEFVYEPVKLGERKGRIYIEVHRDVYQRAGDLEAHAFDEVARAGLTDRVDVTRVRAAVKARTGIPEDVTLQTAGPDLPDGGTLQAGADVR